MTVAELIEKLSASRTRRIEARNGYPVCKGLLPCKMDVMAKAGPLCIVARSRQCAATRRPPS
jgi:hypothetical protein